MIKKYKIKIIVVYLLAVLSILAIWLVPQCQKPYQSIDEYTQTLIEEENTISSVDQYDSYAFIEYRDQNDTIYQTILNLQDGLWFEITDIKSHTVIFVDSENSYKYRFNFVYSAENNVCILSYEDVEFYQLEKKPTPIIVSDNKGTVFTEDIYYGYFWEYSGEIIRFDESYCLSVDGNCFTYQELLASDTIYLTSE